MKTKSKKKRTHAQMQKSYKKKSFKIGAKSQKEYERKLKPLANAGGNGRLPNHLLVSDTMVNDAGSYRFQERVRID